MDDLIRKLNLLVKSNLKGLRTDESSPRGTSGPFRLGKQIDHDIDNLRHRIDDALDYESSLEAQVQNYQADVTRLDAEADSALEQGRDADARQLVVDLQRTQQRLAIAQADLDEHRLVTQELINQVNALEAAVAQARQAEADRASQGEEEQTADAETSDDLTGKVSAVLRDTGERISEMARQITARTDQSPAEESEKPDEKIVEDDLAERRRRLSKPG